MAFSLFTDLVPSSKASLKTSQWTPAKSWITPHRITLAAFAMCDDPLGLSRAPGLVKTLRGYLGTALSKAMVFQPQLLGNSEGLKIGLIPYAETHIGAAVNPWEAKNLALTDTDGYSAGTFCVRVT